MTARSAIKAVGVPTTPVVLTETQRSEVAVCRFVCVKLASGSVLLGHVSGKWRAYVNECRHRALPLDLEASSPMSDDGEYLLCHQHGAMYRTSDGLCVAGPCAGERLTAVDIEEAQGELRLTPPILTAGSRE